jgi:hypothetical protein
MYDLMEVIGWSCTAAIVAYFLGKWNGMSEGMEEERKRHWEAYMKQQEQKIHFL